jgi:hypothetical protein
MESDNLFQKDRDKDVEAFSHIIRMKVLRKYIVGISIFEFPIFRDFFLTAYHVTRR